MDKFEVVFTVKKQNISLFWSQSRNLIHLTCICIPTLWSPLLLAPLVGPLSPSFLIFVLLLLCVCCEASFPLSFFLSLI